MHACACVPLPPARRKNTTKPTLVAGLAHEDVVQVAIGGWHCLAVTRNGQVYAWGGNEYFQCGVDAGACGVG